MFQSAYQRRSPGFESNDLGFLRRADQKTWATWVGFFDRQQRHFYNRFQLNNNWWQSWTADGLPLEAAYNMNTHITFKNNVGFHTGGTLGQLGTTYDDRLARGGPAVRQDSYIAPWLFINGDDRKWLVPSGSLNYFRGSGGRSSSFSVNPSIDFKAFGKFSSGISGNWSHDIGDNQWFGRFTDALGTHYTFAHLNQKTASLTGRVDYTLSTALTVQLYAQPFLSKGTYSNLRELTADPKAAAFDDRYKPYAAPADGVNKKVFNSTAVLRWEYRPGSTLFIVWTQGRYDQVGAEGSRSMGGELRDLFGLRPDNTFLVKASYWINW